jgi:hypothetical protein
MAWEGFVPSRGASLTNWRSTHYEGVRTSERELLERGYILPAAWRRRRAICQVGLLSQPVIRRRGGWSSRCAGCNWAKALQLIGSQDHSMKTAWATNGFDSVFSPAGAIGVREENCVLGPSRIRILGLAFGYRSAPVPLWQGPPHAGRRHQGRGVRSSACACSSPMAECPNMVSSRKWLGRRVPVLWQPPPRFLLLPRSQAGRQAGGQAGRCSHCRI